MIFANPSNPTGAVLRRKELKEIAEIAKDNDIFIISDEIYDEVVFSGVEFTSLSQVAEGIPYAIMAGASKGFDSTGFRIGYTIIPGKDMESVQVREKFADFAKMRLSSNTPAQYAFADAMGKTEIHNDAIKSMVGKIESRVNSAHKAINDSDFMTAAKPKGAFYILAKVDMKKIDLKSDSEITRKLLVEEGVQITRGSGFGAPDHIRLVALAPEDELEAAIRKIDKFFVKHSK